MEIFRVGKNDVYGHTIEEHLYISLDLAVKKYSMLLRATKKENLAKQEDLSHLEKPICRCETLGENEIASHLYEFWGKCSHEYDEWDTYVNNLTLSKLIVKDSL